MKIVQGSGEAFTDFLQRLVSAVNNAMSDPDEREVLIVTLSFENANTKCEGVIRPLKAWAVSMDALDIGSNKYHANISGQAIAKGLWY